MFCLLHWFLFPPSITNVPDRQLLNQNQTTKLIQNQKATQDGEKAWTLEYGKVGNKALSYQELAVQPWKNYQYLSSLDLKSLSYWLGKTTYPTAL